MQETGNYIVSEHLPEIPLTTMKGSDFTEKPDQ